MSTQIFVIHGGDAYDSHEEYVAGLNKRAVTLEDLRRRGWKASLGERLGEGYEVYNPQMPNKDNAKYAEWKIWFEKFIPYFQDGVVFVGHSLGGIFLAKYLSENHFPRKIAATFLVAAPYNTLTEHPLADFNILGPISLFETQGGELFLHHSKDDQIVPFSNFEHYQKELPNAHVRVQDGMGHFNTEEVPGLIEDIKSLAR